MASLPLSEWGARLPAGREGLACPCAGGSPCRHNLPSSAISVIEAHLLLSSCLSPYVVLLLKANASKGYRVPEVSLEWDLTPYVPLRFGTYECLCFTCSRLRLGLEIRDLKGFTVYMQKIRLSGRVWLATSCHWNCFISGCKTSITGIDVLFAMLCHGKHGAYLIQSLYPQMLLPNMNTFHAVIKY